MVIPEVVRNGFLTEARLKKYLEADCTVLEQRDPDEGLTLLGAATVAGHADKVLLLLKRGAEADTLSKMAKHSWLPRKDRQELPQQVIYCDDCGSMKGEDSWKSQTNLVERITKITTRVFPQGEGVVLRFINQEVDGSSNLSLEHVAKILTPMKWDDYGNTTIDIKLRSRILRPFIYDKLDSVPKKLERPLLISILTDGGPEPKPGDTVKNAIVECGQSLKDAAFPREGRKRES
ncbi:uncharacterized protein A1O5_12146 [Cladophialophora psammophila CBS 110553]|uniref:Uncharacterized protein n=1 Tax=Cladophialophora psammophila CBS 110553 TaxID=1182543 RepID=W9W4Q8_9EURO|nr:uncharacterized protein A1O5_12146 [Cladophialophora psammophila CBS 110553]EXJ59521.1 hypothetical protein A1O5_12146 [Cladophialophora psammophila CBS 110553]